MGVIGLFEIAPEARLVRGPDSTLVPDIPTTPSLDVAAVGLRQGFSERSNVNPIVEMSRLITDQRMFEAVTAVMNDMDQTKQQAIRTLGAT